MYFYLNIVSLHHNVFLLLASWKRHTYIFYVMFLLNCRWYYKFVLILMLYEFVLGNKRKHSIGRCTENLYLQRYILHRGLTVWMQKRNTGNLPKWPWITTLTLMAVPLVYSCWKWYQVVKHLSCKYKERIKLIQMDSPHIIKIKCSIN